MGNCSFGLSKILPSFRVNQFIFNVVLFALLINTLPAFFAYAGSLDKTSCYQNSGAGQFHCHRPEFVGQNLYTITELRRSRIRVNTLVTGRAAVIDGDTIKIQKKRIRLHGIDAPESRQSCIVDGSRTLCGQRATMALAKKIGNHLVTCEPKDLDRYGRLVAICSSRGQDLNAWMVSTGMALAYRKYSVDYIDQETLASSSKIGIWAGAFVVPWEWRRGKRLLATNDNSPGICRIKGNISRNGRIYHVPGGKYFRRTQIHTSKGERWFCSEAEAREAGWRRSKR